MKIGLEAEFDAAHRLPLYQGKCSRLHGHTYRVEVVLSGEVGEDGMIIDFYDIRAALSAAVSEMDHADLNEVLPNPTAENMVSYIYRRMEDQLHGRPVEVVSVKLWEGRGKWVKIDA